MRHPTAHVAAAVAEEQKEKRKHHQSAINFDIVPVFAMSHLPYS